MPSKEKSAFSQFFKEDAEIVQDIIRGKSSKKSTKKVGTATNGVLPKISRPKKEIDEDRREEITKSEWRNLRSFFRSGDNKAGLPADLTPVLMAPIYTKTLVGNDFPVWVADENFNGEGEFCLSLKEILEEKLKQIGPAKEDAYILKENIERIIHIANEKLADHKPQLAQTALDQILKDLEKQLDVSGDEAIPFKTDLQKLQSTLPGDGVLLSYSSNTSIQLLEAAIFATLGQTKKKLKFDVKQLICRLKDILRVEREKGPERKDPDKLHDSLEFADSMMDFDQLSSMLPGSGSEIMNEERVKRIKQVVTDLEDAGSLLDEKCFLFVDELLDKTKKVDWSSFVGSAEITVYPEGQACSSVVAAFEQHILAWTNFFAAKRIGELEFENQYQDEVHDDFFDHFDWQNFSTEELNNCPYFILLADDVHLFDTEFNKLSALLSDNIPIKIIAVKRDETVHDPKKAQDKVTAWHANTELGALMLSYKNIYIAQATAITPKFLFERFKEGLSAFAPAFFYLLNVDRNIHQDSFL